MCLLKRDGVTGTDMNAARKQKLLDVCNEAAVYIYYMPLLKLFDNFDRQITSKALVRLKKTSVI